MNTLNNLKKLIELVEKKNPELMDVEYKVYFDPNVTDDLIVAISCYNELYLTNTLEDDEQRFFLD